jgi:hypothetical protein
LDLRRRKWQEAGEDSIMSFISNQRGRARHVARIGKMRNTYEVLVGKPEQGRSLRSYGNRM